MAQPVSDSKAAAISWKGSVIPAPQKTMSECPSSASGASVGSAVGSTVGSAVGSAAGSEPQPEKAQGKAPRKAIRKASSSLQKPPCSDKNQGHYTRVIDACIFIVK